MVAPCPGGRCRLAWKALRALYHVGVLAATFRLRSPPAGGRKAHIGEGGASTAARLYASPLNGDAPPPDLNLARLLHWHAAVVRLYKCALEFFLAIDSESLASLIKVIRRICLHDLYVTDKGRAHAVSLTNALCPKFHLPPQYKAVHLPFKPKGETRGAAGSSSWPKAFAPGGRSSCDSLEQLVPAEAPHGAPDSCLAHFLALCCKLVYEDLDVIQDAVRRWGLRWEGATHGGACARARRRVFWCAFGNADATVVVFRGPSSCQLMRDLAEGCPEPRQVPGMGGVHPGLFDALFTLPQDAQHSVFDEALALVYHIAIDKSRHVLLAGHASGGALACLFAQALTGKRPEASQQVLHDPGHSMRQAYKPWIGAPHVSASCAQVAGVFTYGAPRAGDAKFQCVFAAAYSGRAAHYVQPLDLIPCLPLSPAYAPSRALRPALWLAAPGPPSLGGYPRGKAAARAVCHLARGFAGDVLPGLPQRLLGAGLALAPGLVAHLPCVYESALRDVVAAPALPAKRLPSSHGSLHLLASSASGPPPAAVDPGTAVQSPENPSGYAQRESPVALVTAALLGGEQPPVALGGAAEGGTQALSLPASDLRSGPPALVASRGNAPATGASGCVSPASSYDAGLAFEDAQLGVEPSAASNSSERELTLMAVS